MTRMSLCFSMDMKGKSMKIGEHFAIVFAISFDLINVKQSQNLFNAKIEKDIVWMCSSMIKVTVK